MASLAICESLILSLSESGVLTQTEADGLLQDAREAHAHYVVQPGDDPASHREAAALIEAIRQRTDGVRGRPEE